MRSQFYPYTGEALEMYRDLFNRHKQELAWIRLCWAYPKDEHGELIHIAPWIDALFKG